MTKFNIFDEVGAGPVLAYIDSLARLQTQEKPAFTEKKLRDPFSAHIAFLKKELSECKATNEEYLRNIHDSDRREEIASLVREARKALDAASAQGTAGQKNFYQLIDSLNRKIIWLMSKFYLSENFPLFQGQDILPDDLAGPELKDNMWIMYLETINIASMSEVINTLAEGLGQMRELREPVRAYYAILDDFSGYFNAVVACLDSLENVRSLPAGTARNWQEREERNGAEPDLYERLNNFPATANQHPWAALINFVELTKRCDSLGKRLHQQICARNKIFRELFAVIYSCFPNPDYLRATELFTPRGALGKFIQKSKIC